MYAIRSYYDYCHYNIPGPTSIHGNRRSTDDQIAKKLQPIFFDKKRIGKRLVDIVVSILALIVLSPLMLAVAIAVKVTSKGPVLFKQQRAGLGGEPFTRITSYNVCYTKLLRCLNFSSKFKILSIFAVRRFD